MTTRVLVSLLFSITFALTACSSESSDSSDDSINPTKPPVDQPINNPINKPVPPNINKPKPPVLAQPQTAYYSESYDVIANPERGLQKYSISSENLETSVLKNWRESDDKVTIAYRYFMLDEFMDTEISEEYLNKMQQEFASIRAAGLKIIIRFAYSNAMEQTQAQQPNKDRILAHISQLKSVLANNKDVIYSIQAGFIGTWGEFYYTGGSAEFGDTYYISDAQWQNRKAVIDAMLANFPADRFIQVRYPDIKTKLYGNSALTTNTAYKNTPLARIGFFNDAFLNEYGDQGTYSDIGKCDNPVQKSQQFNYLANQALFTPMTGETNKPNETNRCANLDARRNADNASKEMQLTHWSVINRDWYTPFWDNMSQLQRTNLFKKLGYRFVLDSSTVSFESATQLKLDVKLKNTGFARVLYQRPLYLVIKNPTNNKVVKKYQINTDVRQWQGDVSLSQAFDFNLPDGSYKLYLWLPDNSSSLQDNPAYSIQFANQGTWQASTGYNDLLQEIKIVKGS